MKQLFNAIRLITSGVTLSILTGCTTQISGLKTDPSFTYPAVVSGHIAIGGVISSVSPLSLSDIVTYSNQLKIQLSEKRPEFILIPYGVVVNQLGQESHTKLMNDLQTMGMPSDSSMALLKEKANNYRYIVFSRIESDSIQKTLQTGHSADGKPDNTVRPTTSRLVTGSLQVIDITDGKIVWSATAETRLQNVSLFPVAPAKTSNLNLPEALLEVAGLKIANANEKTEDSYPTEPPLRKALEDLFGGFSNNMPKN